MWPFVPYSHDDLSLSVSAPLAEAVLIRAFNDSHKEGFMVGCCDQLLPGGGVHTH